MEENIKIISLKVKYSIGDMVYHKALGHPVIITGYNYDGIVTYLAGDVLYYDCELTKTDPNLTAKY